MMLRSLPVLVIEGLVEDQYKVFPRINQVAVFCTCTVQICNFELPFTHDYARKY